MSKRNLEKLGLLILVVLLIVGVWFVFFRNEHQAPAGPLSGTSHQGEITAFDGQYINFKYPVTAISDGQEKQSFLEKKIEVVPGHGLFQLAADGTSKPVGMSKIRVGAQAIVYADSEFESKTIIPATQIELLP